MSQDSASYALREFLQHEEANRRAFVASFRRVLQESGFISDTGAVSYAYLQRYLGLDKATLWHALSDGTDFKRPEAMTLMRWCHSLYLYRRAYGIGTSVQDQQMFTDIMAIAGYTMPKEINAARRRVTDQHSVPPQTERPGTMSDPEYRKTVQKTIQEAQRQFKHPHER